MTGAEQARLSRSRFEQPQGGVGRHAAAGVPPTTRAPQGAAGYQEVGTARSARQQRSQRDSRRAGVAQHATSRAEGVAAYSARRKKGGAGKVVRTVLIAMGIILATAGGAFAWYVNNINSRLGEGITAELRQQLVEINPQDPFYMLLLGVDKDEARAEDWGSSTANFRSDTIILARVDPPAQKVTLVSIPRDTLVDMGEHGEQKINAAYSYGGAAYMTEVVSKFAGVKISHYAELDFEQFTSIVDTIGGVEVDLPVAISDPDYAEIELPAGVQTLDGTQALGLCRSRHAYDEYGGGDFYRAANQRMVIGAIVKKVLKLDALSMSNTVSELANSVTTDFTATDILGLAMQFKDFDVDTGFYSGQTPTISSYINKGCVLTKYTGARGKSSSNDASAETMAKVIRIMEENGVYWQTGELGAVDAGGGGTIAKYIAHLDIDVVDLGVPIVSMHAPFELAAKLDIYNTYKAFKAFYK